MNATICERQAEQERRWREEKIADLLEQARIPRRFAEKGFANFLPKTPAQRIALEACKAYAEAIGERVKAGACLTLIGPPGTGKTHLLNGIVRKTAQAVIDARYCTMIDFLAAVRGNFAWHGAEEQVEELTSLSLLALDEVWTPVHDRDREALLALIDARYRAQRSTLIASNLTWPLMREALGERFCDRLREGGGLVLSLDGQSHRGAAD